jgi:hypothetical protein
MVTLSPSAATQLRLQTRGGPCHRVRFTFFLKPPTGWSTVNETAKLTASGVPVPGGLGSSVAIGGNAVAAGAPFWSNGAIHTGAIYLFVRPATGWINMTQTFKRIIPDVTQRGYLGRSVAFGGNTIVVAGAPNSSIYTGAAYIFERMP